MKEVTDLKRYSSPTLTPQVLAWDRKQLWMSSRDLGTLYRTDRAGLKIVEEIDPPGVVLAAVGNKSSLERDGSIYVSPVYHRAGKKSMKPELKAGTHWDISLRHRAAHTLLQEILPPEGRGTLYVSHV
jgi:hypothetical protein